MNELSLYTLLVSEVSFWPASSENRKAFLSGVPAEMHLALVGVVWDTTAQWTCTSGAVPELGVELWLIFWQ